MFKTSLFKALEAATDVVADNFEIDGIQYSQHNTVLLSCGRDVVASLADQDVEVDQEGSCEVVLLDEASSQQHAHAIDPDGRISLTFTLKRPLQASDL